MVVLYFIDWEFYMEHEKIYFWGSKRQKKGPQSPKTEFGAQNQYGRVKHPSNGNFACSKKKLWGVKKAKISLQSPKTEFGPKINMTV
jgi:hypothetical protein